MPESWKMTYEPLKKTRSDRRGWGAGKPRGCRVHVYTILEKNNNTLGKCNTSWKQKLRNPTGSSLKALFLLITASTCNSWRSRSINSYNYTKKNLVTQQLLHDLIHDLIRLHLSWNFSSVRSVLFAEKLHFGYHDFVLIESCCLKISAGKVLPHSLFDLSPTWRHWHLSLELSNPHRYQWTITWLWEMTFLI